MSNKPGKPETLADILAEPGWKHGSSGAWFDVTDGDMDAFVHVTRDRMSAALVAASSSGRITIGSVRRAADLMRRIEAAIAREAWAAAHLEPGEPEAGR